MSEVQTVRYLIRRANPKSKKPYRVIRERTYSTGWVRTHKLLVKFATKEAAQEWVKIKAEEGIIDRLA